MHSCYLRPATECIKHVKENKACEGHGRVTLVDLIVTHLKQQTFWLENAVAYTLNQTVLC